MKGNRGSVEKYLKVFLRELARKDHSNVYYGPVYNINGNTISGDRNAFGCERKEEENTDKLSGDGLRRRIDAVLPMIKNQRMWFCICKVLMQVKLVGEGDFKTAVLMIESAFPEGVPVAVDAHELAKLNCESLAKDISMWDAKRSPVGNATGTYQSLAYRFMSLF